MAANSSHNESPSDNSDDPMNFSTLIKYIHSQPQKNNVREQFEFLIGKDSVFPALKASHKGAELLEMMPVDSRAAGQLMRPPCTSAESQFQQVTDLRSAGYQILGGFTQGAGPEIVDIVQGLLDSIGFHTGFLLDNQEIPQNSPTHESFDVPPGPNEPIAHEIYMPGRNFSCKLGSQIEAHFYQMVNAEDGLLIAFNNLSPSAAYEGFGMPDNALPALKKWSDVAYLQWSMCTEVDDPLEFVLQYHVTNAAAEAVVELINVANGTKTKPWPGVTYETSTEEGLALLGTPNGIGVACLLIEHKDHFGIKTIDEITVFRYDHRLMTLPYH